MYSRRVGKRTLTFGHEGMLYKNSFVLYDRETGSLWVHTTGEAVRGSLKDQQLQFLPAVVTSWKKWKTEHPETVVLTGRRADGFMDSFNLNRNPRLYGLSVGSGKHVKLYPFEVLRKEGIVNDEYDGKKLVVVYDDATGSGVAFERGDLTFRKGKGGLMVDRSEREWNMLQGTSGDQSLTPVPATPWLIERWKAFYRPREGQPSAPPPPGR